MMNNSWYLWVAVIIGVAVLLYYIYILNDCVHDKECVAYVAVDPGATPAELKETIQEIVDKSTPVIWPFSLVVAISVALPLIYYVKGSNPTLGEFFVGALFVFIGVTAVLSWSNYHFYSQNFDRIVEAVNLLP